MTREDWEVVVGICLEKVRHLDEPVTGGLTASTLTSATDVFNLSLLTHIVATQLALNTEVGKIQSDPAYLAQNEIAGRSLLFSLILTEFFIYTCYLENDVKKQIKFNLTGE